MEWKDANNFFPPINKPSLILLKDGTQHVGYPERFQPYKQAEEYRWIVGGWENCHFCGGQSIIVFRKLNIMNIKELTGCHYLKNPRKNEVDKSRR